MRFYGCEGAAQCRQLRLAAAFDLDAGLSPAFVKAWNEERAIGWLSVDKRGDPIFTYFLAPETFRAVLALWADALAGIAADIGL